MNDSSTGENVLRDCGLPLFFEIADAAALQRSGLDNRHGQNVRVWTRSLTVMQKEAVVLSARSGLAATQRGFSGRSGQPGIADPVETHVYLMANEGDDFARRCLDMGERTCYLHALAGTPQETRLTITGI